MRKIFMSKSNLLLLATLLCVITCSNTVLAQFSFSDNATNYGGSWTNGSNQGTGFNAWTIATGGANSGVYIGDPSGSGMSNTNIGGTSFALFGHGGQYVNTTRFFGRGGTNVPMLIGDVFSFYWSMNWDCGSSGSKGFDLRADGTTIFNVNNSNSATISTTNGNAFTAYGTNAMLVTLTRTSWTQYAFSMTARNGGATFNTTITSSSNINNINMYCGAQQDNSGNRNIFFNAFNFTKAAPYETNFDVTEPRILTGSNNLTKTGAGNLTLTAPNTFSGNVIVNANFLIISNDNQLGSVPGVATADKIQIGAGTLAISSTLTVNSNRGIALNNAASTIDVFGGQTATYSGIIAGAGSLTKAGPGTLILGGVSTYSGTNTNINAGTLSLSSGNNRLPVSTNLIFANVAGANFNCNNLSQQVSSISGAGASGGNIALGSGNLTCNQSSNTTYSGIISGTGQLIKSGAGTLTLSGVNTYSGITTLNGGTLQLGVSNAIADVSNISMGGGILATGSGAGFSETVGTLNLSANSSIALGTGAHTLTFSNSSAVGWTAATTLTITGWSGTAGTSGTAGKIFFGNTTGTLTAAQLAQISFTGFPGTPILLSTGELVPPVVVASYTWNATTGSANWQTPASWTPARNTPSSTDVLNFTNGGSSVATNIPTETVAQFIVSNNTAITLQPAAAGNTLSLQGGLGGDLSVALGSTLVIGDGANSIAFNYSGTGHTASIAGTLTVSNSSTANNYNTTNAVTTISGTLNNGGSITAPAAQLLINGTYNHTHTTIGGTIPTATWNAASNCNIIGYTSASSASGGFSQTFGNFSWNCTSQTSTLNLFGALNGATIAGNFNIISTGSGLLRLTGSVGFTLNVTGSLNVSGGSTALTNTITPNAPTINLNIGGVLNVSGGTFNFHGVVPSSTGGSPIFNVSAGSFNISGGNFIVYNTTTGLGSTATINISGNCTQSGGTINNCAVGGANGTVTTWNVAGNFSQSAGSFLGATFGINPEIYLNVNGSFTQSAGATISTGNSSTLPIMQIEFRGTSLQNVSVAGSTLLNIWWRLNNASGINLSTNINVNSVGKFIRNSGSISGTGGIVYVPGSQLRYTGSVNMTSTDKEWPVAMNGVSVEIDNTAGVNLHASRDVTGLGGEVRLTNGSLFLGNNDLLIDYVSSANALILAPSAASMFVTNGTGQFKINTYVRTVSPGSDNYVFQIGENTGTAEYSPIHIRFFKNSTSRIIGARVIDAVNPNINTPNAATDYISRYWLITENSAGGTYRDSITVFYTPADVVGTESNLKFSTYNAGVWTQHGSTVNAGTSIVGYQPSTAAFNQTYLPLNGLEITGRRAPININYTWVGTTSNDYNTASNWSPSGIPTALDNITVGVSAPNPCVINSGNFVVNDFTLNGTGNFQLSSGTSITVNGTMSYGGTATGNCQCSSNFIIAGATASVVPPINYGNLNISGGNRTLSSSGTIGICGTYTPGAGTITITGSTVNFNGTAAQTVPAAAFNNLTISNARTTNSVTLDGNIDIAGVFNPSATFTTGGFIVTGNTINYNGPDGQTIVVFNYNNLSSTNNSRILQNTGNIGIAGVFVPGTGTYTTAGSTVVFNGSINQNVPVFNSLTPNRSYHHLIIEGTGLYTPLRIWSGAGITNGITGNMTLNGGQFSQSTSSGGVTFFIDGSINLTNSNARFSQHEGNFSDNNTYVIGNWNQSGGRFDFNTSASGTGDGFLYLNGDFNATGGLITCTSSGTATVNPTFSFNGSAIQSYSRTGGGNIFVDFVIGANKSLKLFSNFSVSDGDIAVGSAATLDAQGFTVTTSNSGGSADEFRTNALSLVRTTHSSGLSGMLPSGALNINSNTRYDYYGSNQNTGFNTTPAITTASEIIVNLSGTLTNNATTFNLNNALTLNSGILNLGAANTYNLTSGAAVNVTSGNFIAGSNAGTLNFSGAGSFTGSCDPYNVYISGSTNFGAGTVTIQTGGTFRINAGGFVNTNAPFYASGSNLEYNTGANYDRGLEWSSSSGRGYPGNVLVGTSTINPARSDNSYTAVPFNTQGNLTINGTGSLFMDFGGSNMTVPLIINGNLTLVGSLSGSGQIGGDIRIRGNWVNNGTGNNYFPNGRAVFFDGATGQSIGGSNSTINPFAFVFIDNASGVSLGASQQVNNQLTLSNGQLSLGNFNLRLNGLNTPITGASSSRYVVTNGSGFLIRNFDNTSTLYPIGPDASTYSPVTMQQSGTADNISVRVRTTPAYSFAVNDNSKMVNLEWIMNETVVGGNNLSTNFQWPLSSEAAGFIRGNGVFQGDYTGTSWQIRAGSNSGTNPYVNSSNVNFTGNLSNRPFILGNINGIIGCVSTVSSGAWNNSATWLGGNIPPPSSSACISHALQITGANTENISALTMNPGGSLTIDISRSLLFESGGVFTNNSGSLSSITGSGTVIFNGSGTIAGGSAVEVNNIELNGLTTLSTGLTINSNLTLKSGSSLSATPIYGSSSSLTYFTGGSYNVNLEWTGNNTVAGLGVPNHVQISNNTTINMPSSDRGISGSMNISSGTLNLGGGDLYINGDWTRHGLNGVFNANNKAVFFNRSGTQQLRVIGGGTETFNYLVLNKPSGNLVLSNTDLTNITINGNVGNILQFINNGGLDLNGNQLNLVNNGGNIFVSGGVRSIQSNSASAQVNVQSNKSVISAAGGSLVFDANVSVNLSAGMDFGSAVSTIGGTLQIALGGFVNTNPPTYANNSTLRYFSGNAYNRGVEWSTASGPGYPFHVVVDQNGTVTQVNLSAGSAVCQSAGDLNINNGAIVSMGNMNVPLNVRGNLNIGGALSGTLTLSSSGGGDLQIGGNLTLNSGGTFNQSSREVEMNGSITQNIFNINSFQFLAVNNTGGGVLLNANTDIINRLRLAQGLFNLNGFNATMANNSMILRANGTMSNAPTVNVGNVYDMRYDASVTSSVEFLSNNLQIRDLIISNGVTLTLNGNRTFNSNLDLAGNIDLAGFIMTARGRAVAPAFSGSIMLSGGGTKLITGPVGSRFNITGLGANVPTEHTKSVSSSGGTLLSFDNNVLVAIGDGAVDFGAGNPTTINGALQVLLGGSVGLLLNPCFYAPNSILRFANTVDYQVGLNDKTWASGAINSGSPGIPWNVEVNDFGTDLSLQSTRALRGNLTITNGTFTLTPAFTGMFALGGNWTRTGASSTFTHNNKKVIFDRQIAGDQSINVSSGVTAETFYDLDVSPAAGNLLLNANVNVLNAVGLISGKVALNGFEFRLGTIGSNGTITGGSNTEYFISGNASSKLIRFTTTPNTTYNYPLGDALNYTPFDLQLYGSAMASNSQMAIYVVPSAHPNVGTSTNYLSRYWKVEPSNYPTLQTGYGVVYRWAAADEITAPIPANLKPAKYNNQGWVAATGSGVNFEMGVGTVNPGTRTITWDGLYSFSEFTSIGNGTPLPISLLDFNVRPVLNQVEITWTTASETNNDFFTIERSQDGREFIPIGLVDGAGNSNTILNYKLMDADPYVGISYYRLKQTDFDGKFEYSEIKSVNFMKPNVGHNWSIYPNPSDISGVYLVTGLLESDLLQVQLTDLTGKVVFSDRLSTDNESANYFLDFKHVNSGIYYLTIVDGSQTTTMKLILTSHNN
jgi:autotransporter-associated beta strand protein